MSKYVISFAKCGTDELFILFLLDIYQKLSTMSISPRTRVYVVLENKYLLKLFSLINPIVGQLTKKNQQEEEEVLFGISNVEKPFKWKYIKQHWLVRLVK